MRKAIALLLTLVVALSLGTAAYAATSQPGTYDPDANPYYLPGQSGGSLERITALDNTEDSKYSYDGGELFLADTKEGHIVGNDTWLQPGKTYKFDVYLTTGTGTAQSQNEIITNSARLLNKDDIGNGNVKFRIKSGSGRSAIQSTRVRTKTTNRKTTYQVEIVTRDVYGTKLNDVEYELSATVSGKNAAMTKAPAVALNTFKVGFATIDDDMTDVGEEGTLIISNTAPVVLKDQFTDIAQSANYKNIYVEGEEGNWSFKGKVAGMKDTNFYYDHEPDTDLMNKFPDQEFKFLTFRGGVNFPTTGEMRIDVSDVSDVFNTMYAYLHRDGKLTAINGTYDSATDELVFRTNHLGRFIISNERITDTSIVPEEPAPEEPLPEPPLPVPPSGTGNPATGTPVDMTMALGLVTLAAAALVGKKNRK